MSVVQTEKSFYICHIGSPIFTYCESVFRKSLLENVEVFSVQRAIRMTLILVLDYAMCVFAYMLLYLSECEVYLVYLVQGLSTTFQQINEISLTLS